MPANEKEGSEYQANDLKSPNGYQGSEFERELIDFRQYFRALVRAWWLVLIFCSLGALKGLNDMHSFSPQHTARMVVLPIGSDGGNGNSPFASQIASALGLNATSSVDRFSLITQQLSSIQLARVLNKKYKLMHRIYGGNWNEKTKTWIRPTGAEFEFREKINRYLNLSVWEEPTIEQAAGYIAGSINISTLGDTPFREMTVVHSDSKFALWLLEIAVSEAVEIVRAKENEKQFRQRNLIERRLKETVIVEFRDSLSQLLANETKKELLLSDNSSFGFEIVEPPYVSNNLTHPNIIRMFYLPVLLGGAFAAFLIMVLMLLRSEK